MRLLQTVLCILAGCLPLAAQDTKAVSDELCHLLRQQQKGDGSYGDNLSDTCRVLDVLGRSPRRYTDIDGPFIRTPAQLVAAAPASEIPDALVALALAGDLAPELQAARDAAVARLVAAPPRADLDTLLALRTLQPGFVFPVPAQSTEPALECLLAADPASVSAPPVSDVGAWTAWARAARLRGLKPAELPPLPEVDPAAPLPQLVQQLETVIQMHGLHKPAAPATAGAGANAPVEVPPPGRVEPGQKLPEALARAAAFLDAQQQEGTFGLNLPGWSGPEPGVTALCLSAALNLASVRQKPRPAWIDKGLDYLVSRQQGDGSIREEGLDVYTTSVAIEALTFGGRDKDRPVIEKARRFLLLAQADEGEGYRRDVDAYYGGVGYGGDERPDLSNTQMALEAAARAGTPSSDPFFTKARVFLDRCQNYSEAGALAWPRPGGGTLEIGNDGGSTYMPGNSPAGERKLREGVYQALSYGSMTYALVKSYIFCDVPKDDPRMAAAVRWLAANFTVERNPGFDKPEAGADGLYYYYLAMARTLQLLPEGSFRNEQGELIPWEDTLTRHLLDQQRTDGSWINDHSPRWWEGAPTLCTAYAALALTAAFND